MWLGSGLPLVELIVGTCDFGADDDNLIPGNEKVRIQSSAFEVEPSGHQMN